jgi:hypothetical protein
MMALLTSQLQSVQRFNFQSILHAFQLLNDDWHPPESSSINIKHSGSAIPGIMRPCERSNARDR